MDITYTPGPAIPAMQPYDDSSVIPVDGFEALYLREYPALAALATALAGWTESEDLVQDTMVKALINWDRVRRLERPGGWCHRVLVNACRGRWRRRRTEQRFQERRRRGEPVMAGPGPEIMAFWEAVRRLPSRPRMVVALYYAADRSAVEVASILGVPEGTVRSDLTRARAVLATELGI